MDVNRALLILPEAEMCNRERLRLKATHQILLKMPLLLHDKGADDELEQQWINFNERHAKLAFGICRLYFGFYVDRNQQPYQS